MAFSFAVQPADYALRARAGLPVDPSVTDGQASQMAAQALSAPPATMGQQVAPAAQSVAPALPDLHVSPIEGLMSWLAHGGTPAEAMEQARAVKVKNAALGYQLQQAITQQHILQSVASDMDTAPAPATQALPAANAAPGGPAPLSAPMSMGGFRGISPRVLTGMAFVNPQAADALASIQKLNEVAVGTDGRTYQKFYPGSAPRRFANPTVVNGSVRDINDPANLGQYTPAPPTPGAQPLYDGRGNIVDWMLPSGVRESIALQNAPQMARAQAALIDAGAAVRNAGTSAASQQNTASQNVVQPPSGFVVRPRRR